MPAEPAPRQVSFRLNVISADGQPGPAPPPRYRFPDQLLCAAACDPRLRGHEAAKDALAVIAHHAAASGTCHLSDARIAAAIGRDPKTVKRSVARLESLGYLIADRGVHRSVATVYMIPVGPPGKGDTIAPPFGHPAPPFLSGKGDTIAPPFDRPKGGACAPLMAEERGAQAEKGGHNCAPPTSLGSEYSGGRGGAREEEPWEIEPPPVPASIPAAAADDEGPQVYDPDGNHLGAVRPDLGPGPEGLEECCAYIAERFAGDDGRPRARKSLLAGASPGLIRLAAWITKHQKRGCGVGMIFWVLDNVLMPAFARGGLEAVPWPAEDDGPASDPPPVPARFRHRRRSDSGLDLAALSARPTNVVRAPRPAQGVAR